MICVELFSRAVVDPIGFVLSTAGEGGFAGPDDQGEVAAAMLHFVFGENVGPVVDAEQ